MYSHNLNLYYKSDMRSPLFLTATLLAAGSVSWATAQSDPFERLLPKQTAPVLRAGATASAPQPAASTGGFGNPRVSNGANTTKVVFDLPAGMSYTLTPTFTGLRLDVRGGAVIPSTGRRLGNYVTDYRALGTQMTLFTPYPLAMKSGWTATEAVIASGGHVLILEFGPTLRGGPDNKVAAKVSATPSSALNPALSDQLPPGDNVQPSGQATLPPAATLPGQDISRPSDLVGRVPGSSSGQLLPTPRIGKNPGMTRVVLDLPPGTEYRIAPGLTGLRVDLRGVSSVTRMAQEVSPELIGWRFDPQAGGVALSLITGNALSAHSGWRSMLLPPVEGSTNYRLAIDFSPAMANLTPLSVQERVIARVSGRPNGTGTAILGVANNLIAPRVVIDPGHGGRDPGAVGTVVEKAVTLEVALRVRDLLRSAGVNAVMTRETDRELHPVKNTDLVMRAQMGTPGTDMFVSIHVNALLPHVALRGYGVETWWNPNHPRSAALASILQKNVISTTEAYSRGIKNNQSLSVLRNSRIPAALVEIGYTSHPVDGLNLTEANYLDRVAVGIARGIREALVSGVTASGEAHQAGGPVMAGSQLP